MNKYIVKYKSYDEEGRVSFGYMTIKAKDDNDVDREFTRIWGLDDVHIVKIDLIKLGS